MKTHSMIAAAVPWLLVLLFFTCLQHASAQPGWLSVDCGAPAAYVDERGVSWVPDDAYVTGGATATVTLDPANAYAKGQSLTTLRYFPDVTKTRICYNFPVKKNQAYLGRWVGYHGGYDSKPNVQYDLSFDLFGMSTISYTTTNNLLQGEGVFRTPKESVTFCLFRILATDSPFMSSFEFRPLDNSMYAGVAPDTLFNLMYRFNLGTITGQLLRYPEDPYDRSWFGFSDAVTYKTVTAASVKDSGFDMDKPPLDVMNTAITTIGAVRSIRLVVVPNLRNVTYVANVHLAELQILTAGSTRVFDISLNGEVRVPNVNIYSLAQNSLYKPVELTMNGTIPLTGNMQMDLTATSTSTLGPLVNAVELFSVFQNKPGTFAADGVAIASVKKDLGLMIAWAGDPCIFKPYDWLQCTSGDSPRVTAVRLSKYNLTGGIPVGLRDLTEVIILELDNNMLTGPIPEWLASLPNLKELYLQNNNLQGNVPKSLLSNTLLKLRVDGNPSLCVNTTSCASDSKPSKVGIIAAVVAGVLLAVAFAVGVTLYCCCIKKKQKSKNQGDGSTSQGSRYTLAQVMQATQNNKKILGRGGFGFVYYGKLSCGKEVAVKVCAKDSRQGSKEFINEIDLLTRIHHKYLVSLVGYCDEGKNLILIYEYMPMGTVQEHLYGVNEKERASFLTWPTRLQIALQAAQGLEYLHVGCNPSIFHRDVKSNNILLGDKMVAKVGDFGLSKSTESKDNVTHVSTMVKGTPGYLDPEYFHTHRLTEKTDVYAFGIVLLELICGRPPFLSDFPEGQRKIDKWVRPYLQAGNIEKIVDPDLKGQYDLDCMWKVAELAIQSVEPQGMHRPKMSKIVQELRDAMHMEESAGNNNLDTINVPGVHKLHGDGGSFQSEIMPGSSDGSHSMFSSDNSAPFMQPTARQ